jgi:hypothetical protein
MMTDEPCLSSGKALNGEVNLFEIDGYHLVEALLCHVLERQELAVTCIREDAVQVPELPLDRGDRVEVSEIADVRANGKTSRSSVSLVACSVLSFKPQMATRAPSLSNSCAGQPDPAVAAGDKDILVR